MAEQYLDRADAEHGREGADENIGRYREELSRFTDPAQVHDGDKEDRGDTKSFAMREKVWQGRGKRGHSGRDADGHGQDIVDHQGRGCDQSRPFAEIRFADNVGAAALRIFENNLPIGHGQNNEQADDGQAERNGIADHGRAGQRQDEQNLFRGIGHRG